MRGELAMNDRGVLPRGAKGRGPMYPQTWWCVLRGGPAKTIGDPAEARALEREIEARRVGDALNRWPTKRGTFTP